MAFVEEYYCVRSLYPADVNMNINIGEQNLSDSSSQEEPRYKKSKVTHRSNLVCQGEPRYKKSKVTHQSKLVCQLKSPRV